MNANLFSHPERAGLYHLSGNAEDALAQGSGRRFFTIDLHLCRNADAALREIGRAAGFPKWYGANLDALNDCLNDPDWRAGQTSILKISGLAALRRHSPDLLAPLIEILRTACQPGVPGLPALWVLVTDPVRGVDNLPDA